MCGYCRRNCRLSRQRSSTFRRSQYYVTTFYNPVALLVEWHDCCKFPRYLPSLSLSVHFWDLFLHPPSQETELLIKICSQEPLQLQLKHQYSPRNDFWHFSAEGFVSPPTHRQLYLGQEWIHLFIKALGPPLSIAISIKPNSDQMFHPSQLKIILYLFSMWWCCWSKLLPVKKWLHINLPPYGYWDCCCF